MKQSKKKKKKQNFKNSKRKMIHQMQASFNNINSWLLIRKYGSQKLIDDKLLKELKEKKCQQYQI